MPTTKRAATTGKRAASKEATAKAGARKAPARAAASTGKRKGGKNAGSATTAKTARTAAKGSARKSATKAAAKSSAATVKRKAAAKGRTTEKSSGAKSRSDGPARKSATRRTRSRRVRVLTGPVRDIAPYKPKRGEAYMNDLQLAHFRKILLAWKRELMEEVDRTMHHMKDDAANFPDPNDRATQESEFGLELRTRDRDRKLLRKIDSALARIDDGSYGYCDETGEEIGLRRLEARPVATLCLEAQERRELAERQFRDREDYYR